MPHPKSVIFVEERKACLKLLVLCSIYNILLHPSNWNPQKYPSVIFSLKAVSFIPFPYWMMVNSAILGSWTKWRGSTNIPHPFWKNDLNNPIILSNCLVKYYTYPNTMGQSNKMQELFHSYTHKCSYILGWNKCPAKTGCKRDLRCLYDTPMMLGATVSWTCNLHTL